MLFAFGGVFCAALLLALLIVGAYVDHDRSSPKQRDVQKEQP